jgi:gamma-glutamylcyclotransferase (GGCT)/AIG2-like uncharacterized protein YtfP
VNDNLFVYGSLIFAIAHPMGERLRREAELVGPARLQGRLYKVSWYPAMVLSDALADAVHGEVYRLRDPAGSLAWLDDYEGIVRGPASVTSQNAYSRDEVPVTLEGGRRLVVWTYIYRRDFGGLPRVMSGRWSTDAAV